MESSLRSSDKLNLSVPYVTSNITLSISMDKVGPLSDGSIEETSEGISGGGQELARVLVSLKHPSAVVAWYKQRPSNEAATPLLKNLEEDAERVCATEFIR
jgi:hypothetical protein